MKTVAGHGAKRKRERKMGILGNGNAARALAGEGTETHGTGGASKGDGTTNSGLGTAVGPSGEGKGLSLGSLSGFTAQALLQDLELQKLLALGVINSGIVSSSGRARSAERLPRRDEPGPDGGLGVENPDAKALERLTPSPKRGVRGPGPCNSLGELKPRPRAEESELEEEDMSQ